MQKQEVVRQSLRGSTKAMGALGAHTASSVLGLFFFLVVAVIASGQTVYSNFGANNSFSTNGWCVSGAGNSDCGPSVTRWIAASFTPTETVGLSSITLALTNISGTNGAVVSLRSDLSRSPGPILQSWVVNNLPPSNQRGTVTVTSNSNVTLLNGQVYWVEVEGLAADSMDFWFTNNLGLAGGLLDAGNAGWIALSGNGGQTLPAFSVLGTSLGTLSATPPSLSFTASVGQVPTGQAAVSIASSGGAISFTISTQYSSGPTGWISESTGSGVASPGDPIVPDVGLSSAAAALAVGTYSASLVITSANQVLTVPVSLKITAPASGIAQNVITTVAGTDFVYPKGPLPGLQAPLGAITGLVFDSAGNLYIADTSNNLVLKMDQQGTVTVFAGNGTAGFSGDGGAARNAALNLGNQGSATGGLATDTAGNLFIADSMNNRVRMVSSSGVITTIAGNGQAGFSGDGGNATLASLNTPASVAVDGAGDIFIGDWLNGRVRKVSAGIITTVAGNGTFANPQIGPAVQSPIQGMVGIAVDTAGNLYFGEQNQYGNEYGNLFPGATTVEPFLAKVSAAGVLSLIPLPAGPCQASAEDALAFDSSGNLYIVDSHCSAVYKMTPDGVIVTKGPAGSPVIATVAGDGSGTPGFSGDGGPADQALLNLPLGLAADSGGDLFIADSSNFRLRKVTPAGIISTVGGPGYSYGGDGGAAISANLSGPEGVAVDPGAGLFIADTFNNRIRRVTPNGIVSTFAGTGAYSFSGDGGPATAATLRQPNSVAVGVAGTVWIADSVNSSVRRVDQGGTISTVFTLPNNLLRPPYKIWEPAVAADAFGDVFSAGAYTQPDVVGFLGDVVKVAPNGAVTTVAKISTEGIASDAAGNLVISDGGATVYRVTTDGVAQVIAGNGRPGFYGDGGPATAAELLAPSGVAMDAAGNVYIADPGNQRIRKVTAEGIISTVAGTGNAGFSGDGGPATAAEINNPGGVAVDAAGNLYIADAGNNRIREVLARPPGVQLSPTSLIFTGQSTGAPAPTQSFSVSSVPGLGFSLTVAAATGNWLSVTPQSGSVPRLIEVTADPSQLQAAGTYTGTITVLTPNANPPVTTISVTFQVSAAQVPTLAPLDPQNFSFSFVKSSPAQSQRLTISNSGGGILNFTATATIATPPGAQWLTLSQTSGQATPSSPAILTVKADPTGLGPGTYTGAVSVTAGPTALSVPVTITVSALDQAILLSQRGLFFTAVAQGGVIPPQTFSVLNIGTGVVGWTAKAIAIPASPAWFSVSPASGSTDASQSPPVVTVTVDPSKLAVAGTYYGLVEVDAPNAANSPQVLTVVLRLLKAGSDTGAALTPGSLLFTTSVGASSPGSQNVQVYNITANAKSFRSAVSVDPGLTLVTLPTDATLDPQNPTSIVVQPFTTALAAGVYTGVVTLLFDDGRVIPLTVKVIVSSTSGTSSSVVPGSNIRTGKLAEAGPCTPTKLQPILTAPNSAFTGLTGFGVKLGVFVEDDCGNPLQSGSVKVRFSNGDTTSTLQPLQGGLWEGTWYTQNPSTSINLTVQATNSQGISGSLQTNGSLASDTPPVFDEAHIFSAFGATQFLPLAPGEVITIYGTVLAEPGASLAAPPPPLSTTLVDTTVTVAGIPLPLYYVSDTQVNAVVAYGLSSNSLNAPLQMLVQRGNTLSQPVYVTVATAEPTIYGGPNAVVSHPASGASPYIVSSANPAHGGDIIVLYCLGLGAVSPPVADGGLATAGVLSWASPIQMMIGNQPATVLFQGLTPLYPGLYQVNAVIPAGVPTGSSVPVTISSGGQTSPPIQIPIQ